MSHSASLAIPLKRHKRTSELAYFFAIYPLLENLSWPFWPFWLWWMVVVVAINDPRE